METTKPVLEYYSKNPNFHEIDGALEIDEITNKIDAFLGVYGVDIKRSSYIKRLILSQIYGSYRRY